MTTLNLITVVGTDGLTPIRNPEGRMEIYALKELWDKTVGEKRFIPNIGDLVTDTDNTTNYPWWKVQGLDVDLVAVLVPWNQITSTIIDTKDVLTGPGRFTHNNTYRIYYNKSVTPHVLTVENRMSFKGTVSRYAKIMRQVNGPSDLKVISAFYDNLGNVLGQDIPLELVGVDAQTNRSEYAIPTCYTMEDLPDGEVVTVHAYTEDGHPSSITELVVQNTTYIRHRNEATRYITGVSLSSPFMSETDLHLILLPVNIPLAGLYLMGRVHYSDGSTREYPVDGVRFKLNGMEAYLDTIVNQNLAVWLQYTPLPDEVFYGSVNNQKYNIRTMEAKGMYNVRLYCYPEWTGPLNGYHLRWFLYSAERNTRYDVTEFIQYTVNTPGFQSSLYGVNQALSVSVNLKNINPLYENVRHAQIVQVVLWRQGTERATNWTVVLENGQDPAYGVGTFGRLEFINHNFYKLNLSSGFTTQTEWLAKLYKAMRPVVNPMAEIEAPLPTHFRIRVGASEVLEKSISQWNETFTVLNGLVENGSVYIEWIRKTPETDLEMGTSGLILWDNAGIPL